MVPRKGLENVGVAPVTLHAHTTQVHRPHGDTMLQQAWGDWVPLQSSSGIHPKGCALQSWEVEDVLHKSQCVHCHGDSQPGGLLSGRPPCTSLHLSVHEASAPHAGLEYGPEVTILHQLRVIAPPPSEPTRFHQGLLLQKGPVLCSQGPCSVTATLAEDTVATSEETSWACS